MVLMARHRLSARVIARIPLPTDKLLPDIVSRLRPSHEPITAEPGPPLGTRIAIPIDLPLPEEWRVGHGSRKLEAEELALAVHAMPEGAMRWLCPLHRTDGQIEEELTFTPIIKISGRKCAVLKEKRFKEARLAARKGDTINIWAHTSERNESICIQNGTGEYFLRSGVGDGELIEDGLNKELTEAIAMNDVSAVQWLISRGADPGHVSSQGRSMLELAIACESIGAAEILRRHGAREPEQTDEKKLSMAVEARDPRRLEELLDRGADADARNATGEPAVVGAAQAGNKGMVMLLLDNGADVNASNLSGETALIAAACRGHNDIVRILLSYGADPHRISDNGSTAYDLALVFGHRKTARILKKGIKRLPDR